VNGQQRLVSVWIVALLLVLVLGPTSATQSPDPPRPGRLSPEEAIAAAVKGHEIGDDFKLSTMGPYGNPNYDALNPAVAYSGTEDEYLVVWSGSHDVVGEYEIWGQRVDATTGAQLGADFQISFIGPADNKDHDAEHPDVVYNPQNYQYLVVWSGDHYADGDFEIFGRRVRAGDGALLGSMVRISVMGPGVDPNYDGLDPAVAFNRSAGEYLVVWEGDDHQYGRVDGEFEIWGRRLDASTNVIGEKFRISYMGEGGNPDYDAYDPDVAYNSQAIPRQYVVVWEGDTDSAGLANEEFEIWGQRVVASGGLYYTPFRISDMGPDNNPDYDALDPAIAYNRVNNQYLVVWEGEGWDVDAYDIFGQLLDGSGNGIGDNDFYVSNVGDGANSDYDAVNPAVAFDRADHEYLVVWQDDEVGAGEYEIWGQRLDATTGDRIGRNTRLSSMGLDGDENRDAQTPAVSFSRDSHKQYLVTWSGDHIADGEFEIWAQRFTAGWKSYLPLTLRNY
jgi:hypothetical protein